MIIGTITLLSILFFGGGDFSFEKAFKPFLKDVVEDKARQEQILDVTKEADGAVAQFKKEVNEVWAKDLIGIVRDYDATKEDFEAFVDRADGSRLAAQRAVVDFRFDVVKLMSEDEWNEMYRLIYEKRAEEKAKREEIEDK
jgi:hypothetical protein